MALGHGLPVPFGGGRHENPVLRRLDVCWAFERRGTTRERWLLLPGRQPVSHLCVVCAGCGNCGISKIRTIVGLE